MKKFSFNLEKILVYKDSILDKEKNALATIKGEKAQKEEELTTMVNRLSVAFSDKDKSVLAGKSVLELMNHKYFIDDLKKQIKAKKDEINLWTEKEEKQTKIVAECSKDVKRYEKLKEKKLEEYEKDIIKKDNEVISEFVSISYVAKGREEASNS
ncbi:MAG: flagellar export protein FliJ [Oscillospiraceae bacterium]